MRLSLEDYDYAVAASKPSAMTLRLLEKLFLKRCYFAQLSMKRKNSP